MVPCRLRQLVVRHHKLFLANAAGACSPWMLHIGATHRAQTLRRQPLGRSGASHTYPVSDVAAHELGLHALQPCGAHTSCVAGLSRWNSVNAAEPRSAACSTPAWTGITEGTENFAAEKEFENRNWRAQGGRWPEAKVGELRQIQFLTPPSSAASHFHCWRQLYSVQPGLALPESTSAW